MKLDCYYIYLFVFVVYLKLIEYIVFLKKGWLKKCEFGSKW